MNSCRFEEIDGEVNMYVGPRCDSAHLLYATIDTDIVRLFHPFTGTVRLFCDYNRISNILSKNVNINNNSPIFIDGTPYSARLVRVLSECVELYKEGAVMGNIDKK